MSAGNYQSFLVCFHEGRTDVYRNGLPLGVVVDGKFTIHKHTMKDGSQVPVEIPSPLVESVRGVIKAMECDA